MKKKRAQKAERRVRFKVWDFAQTCPHCGVLYRAFRTGMTYREVWAQFWRTEDDDRTRWHPKRRHTILGRWHEIKKDLWTDHVRQCDPTPF